jgi:hypothetical protein
MIIPNDDICRRIIDEMSEWEDDERTASEGEFVESNIGRKTFTDKQKEVIQGFLDKYEFKGLNK